MLSIKLLSLRKTNFNIITIGKCQNRIFFVKLFKVTDCQNGYLPSDKQKLSPKLFFQISQNLYETINYQTFFSNFAGLVLKKG